METQVFDTKPLLRPAQLEEARSEIKALEAKLTDKGIEDKVEAGKQFRRVKQTVETQTPRAPESGEEEGRMVARSKQLLAQILEGMPSQEEMRKAPPGAVDKHVAWEKRNKRKILEWKNLQLRLTHGQEAEAANLERHRPVGSSLNMDNAYIPGKSFFMPETSGPAVVFSDAHIEVLRMISPQLADALSMMTNDQRREVKSAVAGIGLDVDPEARAEGLMGAERALKKRGGRPKKVTQ